MRKLESWTNSTTACWAVLLLLLLALLLAPRAGAAGGVLDPSFGEGGVSLTPPGGNATGEAALGLAEDRRGRLVAVGTTDNYGVLVRRYLSDGSVDPSFDGNGRVETSLGGDAAGWALRLLRGGDILVSGSTDQGLALIRYRGDGSRVTSFGTNGHVVTGGGVFGAGALALDVRDDGRIVSGGFGIDHLHRRAGLALGYRPDGSPDRRFAKAGTFRIGAPKGYAASVSGVEILTDGKVLLGGDWAGYLMLARLLPNGDLDRSFGGGDGIALVDVDGSRRCPCSFANALAIGPGGRPLLAGYVDGTGGPAALLARFTPDGRLDRGFGESGAARVRRGSGLILNDLAVAQGGTITAAGYFGTSRGERQLAVLRFRRHGQLDRGFAHRGFYTRHFGRESIASAVLAQPGGQVVIAGRAVFGDLDPELDEELEGGNVLLMKFR